VVWEWYRKWSILSLRWSLLIESTEESRWSIGLKLLLTANEFLLVMKCMILFGLVPLSTDGRQDINYPVGSVDSSSAEPCEKSKSSLRGGTAREESNLLVITAFGLAFERASKGWGIVRFSWVFRF